MPDKEAIISRIIILHICSDISLGVYIMFSHAPAHWNTNSGSILYDAARKQVVYQYFTVFIKDFFQLTQCLLTKQSQKRTTFTTKSKPQTLSEDTKINK